MSLENFTSFFIHFFKFKSVWKPLKAKSGLFFLFLYFSLCAVYPIRFIYQENQIARKKKNRDLNKFYLKKVFKHVLGRNNLTTEIGVLLWKAKWTLLLSVGRFLIYGTLSVDDLFFHSNLPESFRNLHQD